VSAGRAKILFVGDVSGPLGLMALRRFLSEERALGWDFAIANGENTDGIGTTPSQTQEVLSAGVDCVTGGNHTFLHPTIAQALEADPRILRPANYPPGTPGRGVYAAGIGDGAHITVINQLGRESMENEVESPFAAIDTILAHQSVADSIVAIDLHAESSFEKQAFFYYVDGAVAAVIGTHTHLQTADERVSALGTAYISDLGMTGPADSIAGLVPKCLIDRYRGLPEPPLREQTVGDALLCGALVTIDTATRRATEIVRLRRRYPSNERG
jgi:metallophosphoesterase (TIGR00282 family)